MYPVYEGMAMLARMPMMATTTITSISVNPLLCLADIDGRRRAGRSSAKPEVVFKRPPTAMTSMQKIGHRYAVEEY